MFYVCYAHGKGGCGCIVSLLGKGAGNEGVWGGRLVFEGCSNSKRVRLRNGGVLSCLIWARRWR